MPLEHAPIAEEALRLPGAVLVRTDANLYRSPRDVAYEIGIEQPSENKRFANVFRHGADVALYFRHDPAEAERLYSAHPKVIKPSEIASKHWSKLLYVKDAPELASALLRHSYELILKSCPKKGQRLVAEIAGEENRFLVFHEAALRLLKRDGVSLSYTGVPVLSSGIRPAAKFSWNRLAVCFYDQGKRPSER